MTQGVRRHFCLPKFCPTVCSKSHESACNTTEFVAAQKCDRLPGDGFQIHTRRAFGLRNNPEVHRRHGARLFCTAIFCGTHEATGIWGSSILLERTYGIRAEDQQGIPDILDSNGRVSRL
ncbi:MAG: hypothetical protein KGM92_22540 [Acidobacteriota bacterium]|nr:hypothetical protein [Acidobacteriota bacterium]